MASAKSQLKSEAFPKSKKLNLVSGNLHSEKPTDSKMLSEKSQLLNVQFVKFVNLKIKSINLQDSKMESLKSCPCMS